MSIYRLVNDPKTYDWGSLELIPGLLRTDSNGQPQAEIWFGTHASDPSEIADPIGGNLRERIGELPYLVKLLAAAKPLSIQAHPSKQRAVEQFAAGNPSYQDDNHKPELIVAVSEFRALCGFRNLAEIEADLALLADKDDLFKPWQTAFFAGGLAKATEFCFGADAATINALVQAASVLGALRAELIAEIFKHNGADAGLLVSVLMNLVVLRPGEALFLPAGNIHSYLSGLGVEVMAASDNVLRGGLTRKPLDREELMEVLTFEPLSDPIVKTRLLAEGLTEYPVTTDDFRVYQVTPDSGKLLVDIELHGTGILVCVAGEIVLSNSLGEMEKLGPGEAAFIRTAKYFSITGSGTGYLAMG